MLQIIHHLRGVLIPKISGYLVDVGAIAVHHLVGLFLDLTGYVAQLFLHLLARLRGLGAANPTGCRTGFLIPAGIRLAGSRTGLLALLKPLFTVIVHLFISSFL